MINDALRTLELPHEAYQFLCDVWDCIQLFDDVADGDEVSKAKLNSVIWGVFVRMPSNKFYQANCMALAPVMAVQIKKWEASNAIENAGKANERSYMYRAGFYDLVLAVSMLCFGEQIEIKKVCDALSLYGERYEDYKREFGGVNNA